MQNPGFVSLNGHQIKVQKWHQESHVITFSTVIRGEHIGNTIVAATKSERVSLAIDESSTFVGTARLLDRRVSGAGPTAVMRLEVRVTVDADSGESLDLTQDQKLDVILAELRAIRHELDLLRGRSAVPLGDALPPTPGKTMIDFEIPTDDE